MRNEGNGCEIWIARQKEGPGHAGVEMSMRRFLHSHVYDGCRFGIYRSYQLLQAEMISTRPGSRAAACWSWAYATGRSPQAAPPMRRGFWARVSSSLGPCIVGMRACAPSTWCARTSLTSSNAMRRQGCRMAILVGVGVRVSPPATLAQSACALERLPLSALGDL